MTPWDWAGHLALRVEEYRCARTGRLTLAGMAGAVEPWAWLGGRLPPGLGAVET